MISNEITKRIDSTYAILAGGGTYYVHQNIAPSYLYEPIKQAIVAAMRTITFARAGKVWMRLPYPVTFNGHTYTIAIMEVEDLTAFLARGKYSESVFQVQSGGSGEFVITHLSLSDKVPSDE